MMTGLLQTVLAGKAGFGGWMCVLTLLASQVLSGAEPAPLRIGMLHWIGWSPLNVADAEGLWKKRGLQVEVINYEGDSEADEAVVAGRIDVAMNLIGAVLASAPLAEKVVVIGESDWSHGGDKIIMRQGMDPAQLVGKRIGAYSQQAPVGYFLHLFLRSHGLHLSDVEILEAEPDELTASFISGRLPLIVNYDPQALRAVSDGNRVSLVNSATFPGCMPEGFVANRVRLAGIAPERLLAFFAGWSEAVAWMGDAAHWPRLVQILRERTFAGDKPATEAELKAMLGSVRLHDLAMLREVHRPGGSLDRYVQNLNAFLRSPDSRHKVESLGGKSLRLNQDWSGPVTDQALDLTVIRRFIAGP